MNTMQVDACAVDVFFGLFGDVSTRAFFEDRLKVKTLPLTSFDLAAGIDNDIEIDNHPARRGRILQRLTSSPENFPGITCKQDVSCCSQLQTQLTLR